MKLDISKSQMLIQLLKNMVIGLTQLNGQDPALKQRSAEMKAFLRFPTAIDSNQLTSTIDRAKEVAASYDIGRHGNQTPGDYVTALPGMFYHASVEIEHLIQSQGLMKIPEHPAYQEATNVAQVVLDVKRFVKHAHRREHQ